MSGTSLAIVGSGTSASGVQQFYSFYILFVYFPFKFSSKFFLKMLASNSCTEGTQGKDCVLFFSFVSLSTGTRDKSRNKLRKRILPSTGIFLKRAIFSPLLKPWRNLGFVCGGNPLGWGLLVLLAALPKSCSWLHLKSNKHIYRQVQQGN